MLKCPAKDAKLSIYIHFLDIIVCCIYENMFPVSICTQKAIGFSHIVTLYLFLFYFESQVKSLKY